MRYFSLQRQPLIEHVVPLLLFLCGGLLSGLCAGEPPRQSRYLLLDSRIVEKTENVKLTVGTVRKPPANPLFGEDSPWEPRLDNLYGTIMYDEEDRLYKLWYNPFLLDGAMTRTPPERRRPETDPPGDPSDPKSLTTYQKMHSPARARLGGDSEETIASWYGVQRVSGVCYATSTDGIHWDKPLMDLVTFRGRRTNIVFWGPHGPGVLYDPLERDPARRYKMFFSYHFREPVLPGSPKLGSYPFMSVAFSPDGLHWGEPIAVPELRVAGDTHSNTFWAPELNKYVGITRHWEDGRVHRESQRLVFRTESADFINWSEAVEVLRGTKSDQVYAMPVFRHAGVYLGLSMILRVREDRLHCELAWSPDTIHWERIDPGTPLIPNGGEVGDYDLGCVFACDNPVFLDDEIRLFYEGSNGIHAGWRDSFLCLATLRPDGFAGYEPLSEERNGGVWTKSVICEGANLRVSADAEGGTLRVGIVGDADRSIERCKPIQGDVSDAVVQWIDAGDVGPNRGGPIQLQFELDGAKLYSFSFAD